MEGVEIGDSLLTASQGVNIFEDNGRMGWKQNVDALEKVNG
jgi:hypothetical protein